MEQILFGGNGRKDDLSYEGVRVVDPNEGIDETLNITVEAGVITRIEPASGGDVRIVAPAFVDPHVHLRTPGREDEEDIASGTKAAAAGGYCAILAMPNTEPAVDSAAVLGALVELAKDEAEIPVGFFAAISKGQEGAELTEMVELAERGAAGFTDDGRPVASPGLLRRALQYHAVTGRRIAVHCEEAALSRGGHVRFRSLEFTTCAQHPASHHEGLRSKFGPHGSPPLISRYRIQPAIGFHDSLLPQLDVGQQDQAASLERQLPQFSCGVERGLQFFLAGVNPSALRIEKTREGTRFHRCRFGNRVTPERRCAFEARKRLACLPRLVRPFATHEP